jgi:hypothetical protein
MLNAAHQQSAIKMDRVLGEQLGIVKEAGLNFFNLERVDAPVFALQLQPLKPRRVAVW